MKNIKILSLSVRDIRFPTSKDFTGSDAMNPDPDYSCAYVTLRINIPDLEGHGLTFTIGRGNELCVQAIHALSSRVVGMDLATITSDMGSWWHFFTGDSQLRWIGPEKGVIHLATAAVVNAVWDLWAKAEKKPIWKLLADMTPTEFVRCVDFTYITDALHPEEALMMLQKNAAKKSEKERELLKNGYPAYSTSAGWLGYSDDKLRALCKTFSQEGWKHLKLKVGLSIEDDIRRLKIARETLGPGIKIMVDANQKWEVNQAVEWIAQLAPFDPWWIEEPTSPDDILGHATIRKKIAPIKVATGEHGQNRILFKQLLQAEAIDFCQIDSCRLGGVNEVLAVMLMANKFQVPVCPHAGGVGLCEYVQHLSMIDFIYISQTQENRAIEFVDHLHEHFLDPVVIKNTCYMPPLNSGYSITMKEKSLDEFEFHSQE